jgi:hypothetical protein
LPPFAARKYGKRRKSALTQQRRAGLQPGAPRAEKEALLPKNILPSGVGCSLLFS